MTNDEKVSLYANTLRHIKKILVQDYHLSPEDACAAIEEYNLEEFFIDYFEISAHDANETWAKRIYRYWYIGREKQIMSPLYYSTLHWVKRLLVEDYHLSPQDADAAIEFYNLKEFFEADPEMAAHDGNEAWAKRIFEYWAA